MELRLFLAAFFGHFVLVVTLYALLTVLRMRDVRAGATRTSDYLREDGDGPVADRVRRNIANQFELPMIAYFAAAVLMVLGAVSWFDVAAAWLLLAGRIGHTLVQTLTENVTLRGQIYVVTAVATILLMGHLAWIALELGSP